MPIGFEAFVEVKDVITPVITENLSMNGALCRGSHHFRKGQPCQFIIPIAPGVRIVIESRIVRSDDHSTAIQFNAMDPDSFTHLKRMVELNAANPDAVENELRSSNQPECRKP